MQWTRSFITEKGTFQKSFIKISQVVSKEHSKKTLILKAKQKNCLFPLQATIRVGRQGFFYFYFWNFDETDFSWKCKQRKIYNKWHLQVYTAVLQKILNLIYAIKSRCYKMLLNKTFQCLILSKKCKVGPGKIGSFGVAESSKFLFLTLLHN